MGEPSTAGPQGSDYFNPCDLGSFSGRWSSKDPDYEPPIVVFTRDPLRYFLGIYETPEGERWDVGAIMGGRVYARPVDSCPGYYSTEVWAVDVAGIHSWRWIRVEVERD